MRINEYNNFDDFYYEYSHGKAFSWEDENQRERFIGIEFEYNHKHYRMCNEPLDDDALPVLPNGKKGHYQTYVQATFSDIINSQWTMTQCFENLDDALNNWIIDGKTFREVIMADSTRILSKD